MQNIFLGGIAYFGDDKNPDKKQDPQSQALAGLVLPVFTNLHQG